MPNSVNNISFGSPYASEQAEIQRRQKLAELMQKQSMEPIQQQQGGMFTPRISPLQSLAKVMQGYLGGKGIEEANTRQEALAKRAQQERNDALVKAIQAGAGSAQPSAEFGGGPAMPPNPMGAAQELMGSSDPMLGQIGGAILGKQFEAMTPKRAEDFTLSAGQGRFRPGGAVPIASMPAAPAHPAQSNLGKLIAERSALPPGSPMIAAYDQAIRQEQRGAEGRPYYQFLPTAEGVVAGNARTGQLSQPTLGGRNVVTAPADPALQGRISERKEGGKGLGGYATTALEDAAKAGASNRFLDNMEMAASNFTPGKLEPLKSELAQWANAFGIAAPKDWEKETGDIQALTSMAIKMAGLATRQSDAQPSQLQYFKILESMPNASRTPEGFRGIVRYLRDVNNYSISKYQALAKWRNEHGGSAEGFEVYWPDMATRMPLVWNQGAGAQSPAQIPKTPAPGAAGGPVPSGVDPRAWQFMTPAERALWR